MAKIIQDDASSTAAGDEPTSGRAIGPSAGGAELLVAFFEPFGIAPGISRIRTHLTEQRDTVDCGTIANVV